MSMTLRLTDEEDRALTYLAESQGVSKREAAARAIQQSAARMHSERDVRRLTREAADKYGPLLDRLGR